MASRSKNKGNKKAPVAAPVSIEFPADCSNAPYLDAHVHLQLVWDRFENKYSSDEKGHEQFALDQGLNQYARYVASINVNIIEYCPNADVYGLALQEAVPHVYGSFGVHPHQARCWSNSIEEALLRAMQHPKTVAFGEMGLDFYYLNSTKEEQIRCFRRQAQLAVQLNKPIVIHSRDAEEETKEVLTELVPTDHPIHIHCFTGSVEFAQWAINRYAELCIGFTGCITFPGAKALREVVASVPLERIVCETDGPYMAPAPWRGQVSHPGHIPIVAKQIAEVKGVPVSEVLWQTARNTCRVYRLPIALDIQ
eukprot:TRINITY_DN4508_c0_g1_i1.p1 TRINITY_DN4508_c0_g1~~TRINITY_DN4508_c0_g1_i1.p1  ORF type:complete len:309 (+),score=56.54 TRINITY_DN4508_c0_g1_i1:108-1034(+)